MISEPYKAMLRSAARQPEAWRIAAILVVGLVVGMLVTPIFFLTLGATSIDINAIRIDETGAPRVGITPGGLFVVLASFSLLILATVSCAKRLNGRDIRDLTGPSALMRAQFWATLKWMSALLVVIMLLPNDIDPSTIEPQYIISEWLFWLPFALIGLMVQVLAEELFFRGYLQTQITGVTKSYFVGLIVSALVFGIGHVNPAVGGTAGYFPVVWAICFGLVAGDLTARAGTIGPAVAIHLMNNFAAMLITPHEDMFSGFGLSVMTGDLETIYADPSLMLFEMGFLVVAWLAARIAIRR